MSQSFKLPFNRLKNYGILHPETRRSLVSEEMRLIKRRLFQKMSLADLQFQGNERNLHHVILVTSSKPAEGKSFSALNLALSIAMDEKYNVLLVDGDIARATISKQLGLSDKQGLTDIFYNKNPILSQFIQKDERLPFSFIPAGSSVTTATNLFGGQKMKRFIDHIAYRYADRIVIFDAPPLLASTEAVALAQQVGQIIYVIDSSQTPKTTIEAGLDVLGRYDNVNLLLNKINPQMNQIQFGAYYNEYFKQNEAT